MRSFILGLFNLITQFIMWIPFYYIRTSYLRLFIKHLGKSSAIKRNIEIRKPQNITIGTHTTINTRTLLDGRGGRVIIGNNVDIAQDVQIWTLQHDYNSPDYSAIGDSVIIHDYVWIGTKAIILPGITLGKGAVVAAGAIVTHDVPEYTVVAGIPAKQIAIRSRYLRYKLGLRNWFT